MLTHDRNQLITGHFNAQIDCMMAGWGKVTGPEGTGHVTDC